MKPGPRSLLYILDGSRDLLEDMGQRVPDERYEEVVFQALPAECERIRTASYKKRDLGLEDSRYMLQTMYSD